MKLGSLSCLAGLSYYKATQSYLDYKTGLTIIKDSPTAIPASNQAFEARKKEMEQEGKKYYWQKIR